MWERLGALLPLKTVLHILAFALPCELCGPQPFLLVIDGVNAVMEVKDDTQKILALPYGLLRCEVPGSYDESPAIPPDVLARLRPAVDAIADFVTGELLRRKPQGGDDRPGEHPHLPLLLHLLPQLVSRLMPLSSRCRYR